MTDTDSQRRPPSGATGTSSRLGRWLAWLAVLAVIGAVAAAAVFSGRPWIAIAAVLGVLVVWPAAWIMRRMRRHPAISIVALVLTLLIGIVCLGSVFYYLFAKGDDSALNADPGPPQLSVPYQATGQLSGATIALREEIVVDREAVDAITRILGPMRADEDTDLMRPPTGWKWSVQVDGYATFVRLRTLTPDEESLVSSTVTIPVDLGRLPVRGTELAIVPRSGSSVELAGAKGALGATYPEATSTAIDPRPGGHGEVTVIPVDGRSLDVTVAVLKGPLRNPLGHQLYEAFVWGPLPWAVGAAFALVSSFLGDKIKQLLGFAARRALRATRRPDDTVPLQIG